MGTDIHILAELFDPLKRRWTPAHEPVKALWHDDGRMEYPQAFGDRDYNLFAILANVRNGRGFAGVQIGEGFVPISDPRGLPLDLCEEYAASVRNEAESDDDCVATLARADFGDHSQTWLSLADLLAFDWTQRTKCCGTVSWPVFVRWMRSIEGEADPVDKAPSDYCGDVSGASIRNLHPDEALARYKALAPSELNEILRSRSGDLLAPGDYVKVWWHVTYAAEASRFWTVAVLPLLALANKHGLRPDQARFVFGFDS